MARYLALRERFGPGIAFDDDCVQAYDRIITQETAGGSSPRSQVMDRMIAATAAAHDFTLVSRDRHAFSGLERHLRVEVR
ncbi:hypothetical protein [Serinicoccus hydrothermalis]|uniref:hypothetical protein n=1 Tax=Serinicoccus hydrothermalis TaxID=1758689 RepID=UPI0012F87B2E|nr:hypothetical protein [Serinicoccus hydrothermalis]